MVLEWLDCINTVMIKKSVNFNCQWLRFAIAFIYLLLLLLIGTICHIYS